MKNIQSELLSRLMEQSDADITHMPMEDEFDFYHLVSTGNIMGLEKRVFSLMDPGLGKLSEDENRNILYHFIISISLITRKCIERGMASKTAYTLSDLYIQQVDLLHSVTEINRLHRRMVYDYTERMQQHGRDNSYSRHVMSALQYISEHLTETISVDDISEALGLNKSYLCSLFKRETGFTIGAWIEKKKNELAVDYLMNTDIPYIDISNALGFRSYSYFIQTFKKLNGTTPARYRKNNYKRYL